MTHGKYGPEHGVELFNKKDADLADRVLKPSHFDPELLGYLADFFTVNQSDVPMSSVVGLGIFSSYTPVLTASTTNPTIGTGSGVLGRYTQFGKTVFYEGYVVFGTSNVAAGSGTYRVSLPVTPTTATDHIGQAILRDASAGALAMYTAYISSGAPTYISFYYPTTSATSTAVAHNFPWTWDISDWLEWSITYEVA